MSEKAVLVLGGGFGGLAAAHELRQHVPSSVLITVVERSPTFSMGLSNLWVMTGERVHPGLGERPLAEGLARKGVRFVQADIHGIDLTKRLVRTFAGQLEADYLVIALGAEMTPHGIPGFASAAHNLYTADGAQKLQSALQQFLGGKIAVLITRTPFKCPAAPYEAAFLVGALMRKCGIRDRVEIAVYTPEPQPMPVAGRAVGDALVGMMRQRSISFFPEHMVLKVDGVSRQLLFETDEAGYDLLIGVPPHVAPAVVRDAGLVDATGWVGVDAHTMRTRFPGVYAIGDVTSVRLRNGMLLPKAGVFAEGEDRIVAEAIAADMAGQHSVPEFDGRGYCYVETGDGLAALGNGDFFAQPAPQVVLEPPAATHRAAKEVFERTRLETWLP
jgi:sulfide:quinone oxidoreductase